MATHVGAMFSRRVGSARTGAKYAVYAWLQRRDEPLYKTGAQLDCSHPCSNDPQLSCQWGKLMGRLAEAESESNPSTDTEPLIFRLPSLTSSDGRGITNRWTRAAGACFAS